MPQLPIDERIDRAGQLVLRARIFYDLWRYFEGVETRPTIINTMNLFSEFFRFDPHAHFVTFTIYIAALFDKRNGTISLPKLVGELRSIDKAFAQKSSEVDALLCQAEPLAAKVRILRHNLFAHRSATLSYADAFKRAAVTADQLRDLTDIALKIANRLLIARGRADHVFNTLPLMQAAQIMRALAGEVEPPFEEA